VAYIEVRGHRHYYEWIGADLPDPSRPVMVFVHGWGGSARYWESTAVALKDRFNCLLYDLRGFGRSPIPSTAPQGRDRILADFGLETYADDLAVLLDQLNLGSVYLNAHSAGASIALLFLNRYPQRVLRAILTCNGIFEYDKTAFDQFHKFGEWVVRFRPRWISQLPGADRLFMARFLHRPIAKRLRKEFLADYLEADLNAALGTMFSAVSEQAAFQMPEEFKQLSVPTLMVSGECDQIIPAELGRKAVELNPLLEFALIPQTGHFPMLEDAPTYLQSLESFLPLNAVPA
jgi:pimeloyl-ACP methyl ester carboxylesterase